MLSTGLAQVLVVVTGFAGLMTVAGIAWMVIRSSAGASWSERAFASEEAQAWGAQARQARHGWDETLTELTDPGLHRPRVTVLEPASTLSRALAPPRPAQARLAISQRKLVLALPAVARVADDAGDWVTARHDQVLAEIRDRFAAIREAAGVGGDGLTALG